MGADSWLLSGMAIVVIVAAGSGLWWRHIQSSRYRLQQVTRRVSRLRHLPDREQQEESLVVLKALYRMINEAIMTKHEAMAYQASELLKIVFSEQRGRADEPLRIMALAVKAIRQKEYTMAVNIIDAFRTLLLYAPLLSLAAAAEQLTLISLVAFRAKQMFLISKASDFIFLLIENRYNKAQDPALLKAVCHAVKVVGTLALRRKDAAFFREICRRWQGCVESWSDTEELVTGQAVAGVYAAWLYRIVKHHEEELFGIWEEAVRANRRSDGWQEVCISVLLTECCQQACAAVLRPHSTLAVRMLRFLLHTAEKSTRHAVWQQGLAAAGEIAKLAVSRHSLVDAYPVIKPLLETGRKLLLWETRFPGHLDGWQRRRLEEVTGQLGFIAAHAAKQDLYATSGEILVQILLLWQPTGESPSIRKSRAEFARLAVHCWQQAHPRQAKKAQAVTAFLAACSLP